jgi:protoheme ferro-lyase
VAGAFAGVGAVVVLIFMMNQPVGWPFHWDAEKEIARQPADARAEGRTGIVVVALLQPSQFETAFTENFVGKLFDVAIPWPINRLAARDTGVALVDPGRPDMQTAFRPKSLISFDGRAADWDGEPFADKYARGLVEWVPPSKTTSGDIGTFRYTGRAGGTSGPAQRAMLKARAVYYARLPDGYLPQRDQTLAMIEAAFARLRQNPAVTATAVFDIFMPHAARNELFRLLDSGVDTLVIGSALPINSAFEEYRGAYPKLHKMVQAWAKARGKPEPRLLFAPQLADGQGYPEFWAAHLAESAPPPPRANASATLVVSLHGLPIEQQRSDNWVVNARRATARIAPVLTEALRRRGWQNITTVVAQEAFADSAEDPADKLLSVAEVFAQARARGDALAIAVPIEFLSENTDTLFLHSYLMFSGLPGYTRFAGPPADIDWQKPYVRRFDKGPTSHLYIGAPGGDAQIAAGAVLANTLATRLPPIRPLPPAAGDAAGDAR